MDLKNLVIDWNASIHNCQDAEKSLVATNVKPVYEYENKRKTEKIVGYSITLVDFLNEFEKYQVRIDGQEKPLIIPEGNYIPVYLRNLTGKLYTDFASGEVKVSLRADAVELLG